jgi:hypothetical protein
MLQNITFPIQKIHNMVVWIVKIHLKNHAEI